MTSGGCICFPGLRHEIDDLVDGAPDFEEMGGMSIPGFKGQPHIIKLVPDHVYGQNRTKDLIRNFTVKILSRLDNGL